MTNLIKKLLKQEQTNDEHAYRADSKQVSANDLRSTVVVSSFGVTNLTHENEQLYREQMHWVAPRDPRN